MISILLPIRNENDHIEETLDSIIQQELTDSIEILVADGMSDDGTREKLQKYQSQYEFLKVIDNPEKIVSTGFNRALSKSKGQFIIRVDGHSKLQSNFIQRCIDIHSQMNVDCVGGSTIHLGDGIIGESIAMAQASLFGVGGVEFRKEQAIGKFVDTLAFGAYRRNVFKTLGGYDEELVRNQDDEFNFRMIQNGKKLWLDPIVKSYYVPRNSFLKLFKQYFQYGFYKIRVFQKRSGFASWRHLIPFAFVMSLIISIWLFMVNWNLLSLIPIGIYLSASILFTSKEIFHKKKRKIISILILPITFFIIHFSYGLGSLFGLVRFINSWGNKEIIDSTFNKEKFNENTVS